MANEKTNKGYTDEQAAALVAEYEAGREEGKSNEDIVTVLAEKYGKPKRSIVSKLSRDGKYVADSKGSKNYKDDGGPSKKEQIQVLEQLGYATEGLEGATKQALANLIDFVREVNGPDEQFAEAA